MKRAVIVPETRKNPGGFGCVSQPPIQPIIVQVDVPVVSASPVEPEIVSERQPIAGPRESLQFQRIEPVSTLSTDTHFYDGKLIDRISRHPSLKIKRSQGVIKSMRSAFSKIGSTYLSRMLVPNPQNYDPTNQVDALDILCCIYDIYLAKPELRPLIESELKTQADDMATGFCSQGRCTRLLQIFFYLCDS